MTTFKVGNEYRENELSHRPGGYSVIVVLQDWMSSPRVREYDKIKYPYNFINKVKKDPNVKQAFIKK